ncbi:MAG TPA: M14 family zinc carboxypeptidase, partial [Solirubrobacteraceae bacterium]|nr:M14 family zinc carboxypeptidase [Solirubrobacteraceae bacterium]
MSRTFPFALAVALLLAVAPSAGAAAAPAPTLLAPSVRVLAPPAGERCASTTYHSSIPGTLDARLRGAGDWDLFLRDTAGNRVTASRGFGGTEVVQGWVPGGRRRVLEACRRTSAGRSARLTLRTVAAALPELPGGTPQLVRVSATAAQLDSLERAGFDVTHARGRGWGDVVVSGAAQLAALRLSGLRMQTRIADLAASYAGARAADRRFTARAGAAGSALPSGRTTYRTYDEIQAELKQLVGQHPGLVRKGVFGSSYQGREISGLEIARDVDKADGRPVFFTMGLHHAREWPSAEAAMEFAQTLVQEQSTARVARLLGRVRIVILPVVNPDGYVSSRAAFDPGDALAGQDPTVTFVESIAPPGGVFAYRRKNCNGEIGPWLPCELAWGVDPNRNYGHLWGGPGSSPDVTSQVYHGPAPRSESEVQAVWNHVRTRAVTVLVSIHNVAALVLRPPGLSGAGLSPDEARLKAIGDAIGNAAGYISQYGFELYDISGTTEDDSYAATGGYGYTVEMGPPDGNFHMPYETGVVAEWTGRNPHAGGRGGLREGLLIAAEAAADPPDHAILRGRAPAGKVLRLTRRFQTRTSPYCQKGIDPPVNILEVPICLTGEKPPLLLDDILDVTTTVPAVKRYAWHINQSTRPFVGAAGGTEAYELTCETAAGEVVERHWLVIARGQDVTLNVGCGDGPTTLADGRRMASVPAGGAPLLGPAPSVDGIRAAVAPSRRLGKPRRVSALRGRRMKACTRRATRAGAGAQARARAAQRA